MSASLVGSEMCIRDRLRSLSGWGLPPPPEPPPKSVSGAGAGGALRGVRGCLLYTSDAADDM
eukprot:14155518-Alexandrium_andersonii.AAC.1